MKKIIVVIVFLLLMVPSFANDIAKNDALEFRVKALEFQIQALEVKLEIQNLTIGGLVKHCDLLANEIHNIKLWTPLKPVSISSLKITTED